jgi:hypothetical protein
MRKFRDRGGLLRRVVVSIAGRRVPGAPHVRAVGCVKQLPAVAQKTWLWDGHNVFVALLLIPGKCRVAGELVHAQVVLTTVGT